MSTSAAEAATKADGSAAATSSSAPATDVTSDAMGASSDHLAAPSATAPGDAAAASLPATGTASTAPDRSRFDHTSRKVVVRNVLKYLHAKEVTRLASTWLDGRDDLKIVKTKKPPKDNWVKVTLESESMVDPFIELINTGGENGKAMVNGRGGPLFAKRADEMFANNNDNGRDGNNRKRKGRDDEGSSDGRDGKRSKLQRPVRVLSTDEVRDAITPLWRMTYPEQLNEKTREMVNKCAKKVVKEIKGKFRILEREAKRGQRKKCVPLYEWVGQKQAVDIEQTVPSPRKYEYRNKCEFTIGYRLIAEDKEGSGDGDKMEEGGNEKEDAKVGAAAEENGSATKNGDVKVEESTADANGGEKTNAMNGGDTKVGDAKCEEATKEEKAADSSHQPNFRKVPAAGFLAQGWSGGIYPPHGLQNMPDWSCGLADIFNQFLPASPIPPYDSKVHRGVWRTVTLRCSLRTKECMVIVLHAPAKGGAGAREDGADDCSGVFEGEKRRLVEMLTKGAIPTPQREYPEGHDAAEKEGSEEGIRVTSVFFQEYEGLSHPTPDHPVQHVYGKKCLEEKLGQCIFQISPGAFFQTNTEGAEVLYKIVVDRIREVTTDPKQTLLLDVCCGTGTIGLTCLKEGVVGKLIGVDIAEPAIADAKVNAEKNGYKDDATTQFIASPAEQVLPDTMKDIPRDAPIVAVVDPARDGLHGVVVRTLRANEKIQRLVYVSCNPTGTLVRDAAMLCSPPTKKYPGRPFKPTISQPVDMFPQTSHCEMVMTFDRMSRGEFGKYHGGE